MHRSMDRHFEKNLPSLSCTLLETDSTTTAGWLRELNFKDNKEEEIHEHCKLSLARNHALCLLTNNVKEYSQWFPGDKNDVANSLLSNFHIDDKNLTHLLYSHVPSQMPDNFKISPLPQEIVSWIYSWLQKMPKKQQLQETQTSSRIRRGLDGKVSQIY